jgi:hypothetical protein
LPPRTSAPWAAATPLAWIAATVGWRNGFLGLAAVTVLVAVAFYAFVRDRPPDQPAPAARRESLGEIVKGLLEVWTTPGLLPVLAMHFFAYATMLTMLGGWGGPYLYDVYKLDGVERGNVLLAMGAAQILGILAYGPMDRLLRSRKKVVLGGVAISVLLLAALALLPQPALGVAVVLLTAFCFFCAFGTVIVAQGRTLFPDRLAGRGATTVNMASAWGSPCCPLSSATSSRRSAIPTLPIAWRSACSRPDLSLARASTCARATALLRCLLQVCDEIGELAGLLDAVEHHLGVRHPGLGIAGVLGQGRVVPHDAGLDHRLGEVEARRRAGLAAEHAVQGRTGETRTILERVAGLALLVEHALAASRVACLSEGLRGKKAHDDRSGCTCPTFHHASPHSSGRCRSMWDGLERTQEASPVFTLQQSPLAPDTPAITRNRAILFHDPVTWHDDRQPIGGTRLANLAGITRRSDAGRDVAIGRRRAGRDLAQGVPYLEFEGRTAQVQREITIALGMLDQVAKPAKRGQQCRRIFDETGARKACPKVGLVHLTEFHHRQAALG